MKLVVVVVATLSNSCATFPNESQVASTHQLGYCAWFRHSNSSPNSINWFYLEKGFEGVMVVLFVIAFEFIRFVSVAR